MFKQIFILLSLVTAFCCGQFAIANPTDENTVKIKGAFEFSSIDPSKSGFVFTRMQVLETLLNIDDKGKLIPGLAAAWEISEDGKIWLLTLRDDVVFHDGTALTAAVVVKDLNIALAKPGALQGLPISKIEATEAQHIRIILSEPYYPLGAILAHYTTAILADSAMNAEGEVSEVIGTGPFSVYEVVIPHQLVVKRFDKYWGQKAVVEYASYLTGHRAEARVLQARSGQGDIVFGLDPAMVPMLEKLPHLTIFNTDLPRSLALKLNAGHPFLRDTKARQALSAAINRKGIATAILHHPKAASAQLLPAYMQDWYVENTDDAYNLAQAQAQLTELGWVKNSEGWLEKEGQLFELTLITYADRPELTTVATAIQDQWKQLGVKLMVNVTNSSSIPAGHQDGSLEVALMARNYGFVADPINVIIKDFGNKDGGDWGSMNWNKPNVQAELQQLSKETDPLKYHATAQRVATAIYEEKPMIAIAYYVQQTAVNNRLSGFRFDPYERSYFLNELSWK